MPSSSPEEASSSRSRPTGRLRTLAGPGAQVGGVVAPNGRDIVVRMFNINGATLPSLGLFRIGDTTVRDLLRMPRASVLMPRLSPDGRWLTYMSNESGRNEIYVRAFPSMADG